MTLALTFWCSGNKCWMHERVEVGADSACSRWMVESKLQGRRSKKRLWTWNDLPAVQRSILVGSVWPTHVTQEKCRLRWAVNEWMHCLSVCLGPPGFSHPVQLTAPSKSHQLNELFGTARFWQIRRMFFYPTVKDSEPRSIVAKTKKKQSKFAYFLCQILSRFCNFQVARAVNLSVLLHRVLSSQVTWRH